MSLGTDRYHMIDSRVPASNNDNVRFDRLIAVKLFPRSLQQILVFWMYV